ncbi:MAG: Ribonuclease BN [Holosporales bacterium]
MFLKFLGVRGSLPCADSKYMAYGGHTSCVLVTCDDTVLIFDAGTGIVDAWPYVENKRNVYLFLSHSHQDHIIGLPFFKAVWKKEITLHIYSGTLANFGGIQKSLNTFFSPPYFPISYNQWPCQKEEKNFNPADTIIIEKNIIIQTMPLNHPDGAIGYRLNYKGHSLCYITDHEHSSSDNLSSKFIEFIKDADLLIYDSTYSDEYYLKHKGWGHSTWQEALRVGEKANVKRIGIFHHDIINTDEKMKKIEEESTKRSPKIVVLKQGLEFSL